MGSASVCLASVRCVDVLQFSLVVEHSFGVSSRGVDVRVVVSVCLVRQRISVVRGMFHVHRGRETCSSVVQHV